MVMSFGNNGPRRMQPGDDDQRYRLSVILAAEKRPKYWDFHCCRCTAKIVELSGVVLAISDVSDVAATPEYQAAPLGVECKGKWCRTWYEFITLSGRL